MPSSAPTSSAESQEDLVHKGEEKEAIKKHAKRTEALRRQVDYRPEWVLATMNRTFSFAPGSSGEYSSMVSRWLPGTIHVGAAS